VVHAPEVEEPVNAMFEPVTITVNETVEVLPKSVVVVSVKLTADPDCIAIIVPALAFEPDRTEYSKNAVSYDAVGKLYTIKEPELVCTVLAVVINIGSWKLPINVVLSENTFSTGVPEISFTENKLPLKLSVTVNKSPCEPCTVNTGNADPEPYTVNVDPDTVPFEPDIDARDADTFCVIETDPVTKTLPVISNEADGDNFPIPTLPTLSITNGDASGLVSSSTKNELNEDVLLI